MRSLEDMHIGQRVMLTVAIVVIILILLACVGWLSGRWEVEAAQTQQTDPTWVPSKWDDQIDELERQALGEAFKKHIMQLYSIWVTDSYQPKMPPKAIVGARNARDAYIRSMEKIDKRQELPKWEK
jgi:Na+-transporting methylmalonyl-CoA/oxaloacetate decarboxylase gamma subunit